jgi:DNA-binding NtrC family response regulator
VVAATNRDLEAAVRAGTFRADLLYRLNGFVIDIPPLRERKGDIPLLVDTLLRTMHDADPQAPSRISAAAMEALRAHDWPGNVRELRNVLERAAYLSRAAGRDEVDPSMVPFAGSAPRSAEDDGAPAFEDHKSYRDTKAEWEAYFEKRYVAWLLERADGNISRAARAADMDRKYLYKLATRHELHPGKK